MPTIFSKIINGEIPCYRVAENDDFLAFLDIRPNSIGHTLCIPKLEIDDILDLDEETYKNLMLFSRKVAKSIKKATDPENEGWVESSIKDNFMKAKVKAQDLGSLREAAEDFMSCISVAENVLKK